jgi:hypothetical protein
MNLDRNNMVLAVWLSVTVTGLGQLEPLLISQQPSDQRVYTNKAVRLSVVATGSPPLAYQWRFNNADLPDKTNSSISFANVQFTNAGPYSVVISNGSGAILSQTAWISVLPTNVVNLGDRELQFGPLSAPIWAAARKDDGDQMITGDGLTLFYGSKAPGGSGDYDIWMVTRTNLMSTNWSTPVNLGPTINSAGLDWGPRLSPDGLSFYLEGPRPGGHGKFDMYVATRPSLDVPFGAPVNLGPNVNSGYDDAGALVSADNRTLLFTSIGRPGGLGDYDVWMSTRADASAPWGPARNLGAPINSSYIDFPVALSRDGSLLFIKSARPISIGPEPGAIYVSSRTGSDHPFGPPVVIQPILGIGTGGADLSNLSDDGKTLYVGTYRTNCSDWAEVVQHSVTSLPQLMVEKDSAADSAQLELLGRPGATYEIQISEDLGSWTPWLTTNTTGTLRLPRSAATAGQRFYRVLSH